MTLDGVSLNGSTTLTVYNLKNDQYQFNDAVSFINNSDHNIVENCILISDGYLKGSSGILFFPVTSVSDVPDSNLIENNFVKRAGVGIYVGGKDQNNRAFGNIIRGNMVGSEVDSLISWGIQDQNTQNSIIENNIVQNINRQFNIGYYAPELTQLTAAGLLSEIMWCIKLDQVPCGGVPVYYYQVRAGQWEIIISFITIWSMTFNAHQLIALVEYQGYRYLIRIILKFITTRSTYMEWEQILLARLHSIFILVAQTSIQRIIF